MNVQLPCRWEDRPQVWDDVFRRLAWFDRHARRLGIARTDAGVERAREVVQGIVFETAAP